MRRRFPTAMLLLAGLLTTGSQWDLAQLFAWGRMIATYSQTAPLSEAVRMTFEPENLCSLCKVVQTAKQQQDNPTLPGAGKFDGKLLLIFQPAQSLTLTAPPAVVWRPDDIAPTSNGRAAPPLPPPRPAAA